MRPRKRPISQLWYRWGRAADLDAAHVANALQSAGLIEFCGADAGGRPTHYVETDLLRKIPPYDFESTIREALSAYLDEE